MDFLSTETLIYLLLVLYDDRKREYVYLCGINFGVLEQAEKEFAYLGVEKFIKVLSYHENSLNEDDVDVTFEITNREAIIKKLNEYFLFYAEGKLISPYENILKYEAFLNVEEIYRKLAKEISAYGKTFNVFLKDFLIERVRFIEWLYVSQLKDFITINNVLTGRDLEDHLEVNFNITFHRDLEEIKDIQKVLNYNGIIFNEVLNYAQYKNKRWVFKEHGFSYYMLKILLEKPNRLIPIVKMFDEVVQKVGKFPRNYKSTRPTKAEKKKSVASWRREIHRSLSVSNDERAKISITFIKDDLALSPKY
ncbi:hypothetical protein Dip518_001412 [Parelusimicrobium proximum]|uniref:hypothetical protein n=1 Tax=Parelusimicrobium proximum TaxID=3228953 RepID=UPI003D16B623